MKLPSKGPLWVPAKIEVTGQKDGEKRCCIGAFGKHIAALQTCLVLLEGCSLLLSCCLSGYLQQQLWGASQRKKQGYLCFPKSSDHDQYQHDLIWYGMIWWQTTSFIIFLPIYYITWNSKQRQQSFVSTLPSKPHRTPGGVVPSRSTHTRPNLKR